MHQIYLALGSNIENRKQHIETAIVLLCEKVRGITIAPLYETKPRYFEDQNNFLNTVLRGYTDLEPRELLQFTKAVQKEVGRVERFRNGPREIDIDILFSRPIDRKSTRLNSSHGYISYAVFCLQ